MATQSTYTVLTQAEVAALLGISRQEVDNAERRAVTKIRRAVADDAELREAAAELLGLAEGEIQRVAWRAVK